MKSLYETRDDGEASSRAPIAKFKFGEKEGVERNGVCAQLINRATGSVALSACERSRSNEVTRNEKTTLYPV